MTKTPLRPTPCTQAGGRNVADYALNQPRHGETISLPYPTKSTQEGVEEGIAALNYNNDRPGLSPPFLLLGC